MKFWFAFLFFTTSFISFSQESTAGVVISFDDNYPEEWIKADSILKKFHWKASFCISNDSLLTKEKIVLFKQLKNEGHEIAGHSKNHTDIEKYLLKHSLKQYFENEVYPQQKFMKKIGLRYKTFAYPFGSHNPYIDNAFQKEFDIVRATTNGKDEISENNFFVSNSNLIYGLGLDNSYKHFNLEYFKKILEYCKKENKIVVFYAHKPVEKSTEKYEVEYKTLEMICHLVMENKMTFYTFSDLKKIIQKNKKALK